jgi:hypothetical protein
VDGSDGLFDFLRQHHSWYRLTVKGFVPYIYRVYMMRYAAVAEGYDFIHAELMRTYIRHYNMPDAV